MSKRLGRLFFGNMLPEVIRHDAKLSAAAQALDGLLHRATQAVPNLMVFARLDRENAVCIPPLQRLVDAAGGLKPLTTEQLELLAWQFHVDFREVATDDAMLERMVRESIPWHRIKGTPAAVEQALAMYNVEALVDESGTGANWAVYELELAAVPRGGTMANIVRVAEEAAPARCWLRRVYGGYDRRPIVLDRGPALDVGFLDDDSGVWDPETGVKQSFGENLGLFADYSSTLRVYLGAEFVHASRAFYVDRAILDHWKLDNPTVRSHGMVGGSLISLMSVGIWGEKYRWEGAWDHRRWNETTDIFESRYVWSGKWDRRRWSGTSFAPAYPMPRRRIDTHYSFSKSQMVLDFARLDDALVTLDRPWAVVIDNPHRLDGHRLDRGLADLGVRELDIHERFIHTSSLTAARARAGMGIGDRYVSAGSAERVPTRSGAGVTTFKEEVTGLLALRRPYSLPDGSEWTGPWSHRTWRSMGVPANSSTQGE